MTNTQIFITIGLSVLATVLTRALPFFVFSEKRPVPKYISYLGKVLPGAVFGLLVIYCFKSVDVFSSPFGIPELAAALAVVLVHLWKRNLLVSVVTGTAVYMVIIRLLVPLFA